MKILILMQWCRPEPDFKCIPMAKALQARGHKVEVLTGFPNYPGGTVYPGYRIRWLQRENVEGVPVIRVPLYPSHDKSSVKRALNYLSFALSSTFIGPFAARTPDVVYVYNPMGLPGLVFKMLKRAPFVYDIQDLWPDSIAASGMMRLRGVPLTLLHRFFALVYRSSAKIVVLSPGFKRALEARGVEAEQIEVLYNWCNEDALPAVEAAPSRVTDKLEIVYAGNMGRPQALRCVVEAARLIETMRPRVRFTFIGGGTEVDSLKAASEGLRNVRFIAQVPQSEIGRYLKEAHVLLVHLKADPLFAITVPSKIQFYLASGRPLLAGVSGDAAELVQRSGGGVTFESENVNSLLGAIARLDALGSAELAAMGRKGRDFYRKELSLAIAAERLESVLASALNSSKSTVL